MANTYTQIYIHVVFAVQNRMSLIRPEHNDELQKYVTGIITRREQKLIAINNMPDHMHLLVGQRPTMALSDLVGAIKAGSSGFINEQRWAGGKFSWQEGFGAFSYAHSQLATVCRYIANQQEHHRKKTFTEEYRQLLERFKIPHDERYISQPIADSEEET